MRQPQDPTSATRWLPVYNTESIPVPPFAVMRTTGIDSDGIYQVSQPNADSMTEVLINGPVSIPPLTKGSGHRTDPAQVLIETIDGTPAVGNDYGTEASNWKLRKNKTGFRVLGSVGDNTVEATFYGSSFARLRDTGPHAPCRVATTANITLSTDLENGDTLNGVTLATGDRVLVKDQGTPSQNGIYVVAATGTAARATDADSWDELVGALVVVSEGTAKADTLWLCTSNAGGTLGSTSVTWAEKYPNASATESGIVTTATQTLAGIKTFPDGIVTDHITLDTGGSGLADIFKVTDFATETIHLASSDGTYTITAILNANGAGGISGGELRLVASGWGTTFPQLYLQNAAATVRLGQTGTYGGLQITSGLITGGAVSISGSEISGGTIDGGTW